MATKTFYIREPRLDYPDHYRGKPVACVVYERKKDPDIEGEDYVVFAYSICAPCDEFRKDYGRLMAMNRLEENVRLTGFTLPSDSSASAVVRMIMESVLILDEVPRRVKKIVNHWLFESEIQEMFVNDQVN